MKKVCILLIISLLVLGLAGIVSAGTNPTLPGEIDPGQASRGSALPGEQDKGEGGTGTALPGQEEPGQDTGEPVSDTPGEDTPGADGEVGITPEFSTFGIAAVGALGALSYFYIRRKKK